MNMPSLYNCVSLLGCAQIVVFLVFRHTCLEFMNFGSVTVGKHGIRIAFVAFILSMFHQTSNFSELRSRGSRLLGNVWTLCGDRRSAEPFRELCLYDNGVAWLEVGVAMVLQNWYVELVCIQDDISICGMIGANVQTEQGTRISEIVYSDELFSMLYAIYCLVTSLFSHTP